MNFQCFLFLNIYIFVLIRLLFKLKLIICRGTSDVFLWNFLCIQGIVLDQIDENDKY